MTKKTKMALGIGGLLLVGVGAALVLTAKPKRPAAKPGSRPIAAATGANKPNPNQVSQLQQYLNASGLPVGNFKGILDQQTMNSIIQLAQSKGIWDQIKNLSPKDQISAVAAASGSEVANYTSQADAETEAAYAEEDAWVDNYADETGGDSGDDYADAGTDEDGYADAGGGDDFGDEGIGGLIPGFRTSRKRYGTRTRTRI
jgi:hypothetical protein